MVVGLLLNQRMAGNNMQTDIFGPPGSNMLSNAHVMNRAQVPPVMNSGMVQGLGQSVNVGHAQEKLQNALKSREMQVMTGVQKECVAYLTCSSTVSLLVQNYKSPQSVLPMWL